MLGPPCPGEGSCTNLCSVYGAHTSQNPHNPRCVQSAAELGMAGHMARDALKDPAVLTSPPHRLATGHETTWGAA